MKLLFFTTVGCHLCEQAAQRLMMVKPDFETLEIVEVDIAEHDDLMALYGIRIPVVKVEGNEGDLGWPFTAAELHAFLSAAT